MLLWIKLLGHRFLREFQLDLMILICSKLYMFLVAY